MTEGLERMGARVVVVAGPSGSGKSRLAARTGLPVLRLDDFYRDGDDPALPRITAGANAGIVDWDDPASWLAEDAVAAIATLCRAGAGDVPGYDIPSNGRTGWHRVDLAGASCFVAEGLFAQEIVPRLKADGLLADAFCLTQPPLVTFWRRLVRDLREHRKPPPVLVRRGLALMHAQRRVVAHAVGLGCRAVTPAEAMSVVDRLVGPVEAG